MTPQERAKAAVDGLSRCEVIVLKMLVEGEPLKVVAGRLNRTYATVQRQRYDAYKKLEIHSVAQAAVIFTLAGLVTEWRVGV